MPEVFLSYNREDAQVAKLFADGLAREGLEVWWDQTLHSGEDYDEVTEAALREARAVVVLWSPRSVVSRWVRAEATIAHRAKTLVPATIEPCDRPVMFELTQTADLSHWRGKAEDPAWLAFLADVRRMLGRKAGAPAATAVSFQPAVAVYGDAAIAGPKPKWSRRATVLGVAGAGTAAAIAYAGWSWLGRHKPDPRAVDLYKRGQAIQKDSVFESMGEAIEAYKQALTIDPRYADAWGALALSYRYPAMGPAQMGDPQEVREAAQRALALDPDNADARLALICLYPSYRRWRQHEAQLRGFLRDHPDSALGYRMLGGLLLDVGRIEEAVTVAEHAIAIDPARKNCLLLQAVAFYIAGRDSEGDVTMEELRSRWPQDHRLYAIGYYFLLETKRYNEAHAFIGDTSRRPRVVRPELAEAWMLQADALAAGRGSAEVEKMHRAIPVTALIENLPFGAIIMALSGKVDELFALLEAFFFGGEVNGTRVPPPGPLNDRSPFMLFFPVLAGLRGDPRFASLLERIGLEDYWRKSGTQPDFRRG